MDERLLQRIRELEGDHSEIQRNVLMKCDFAERVSFMSDELFYCTYKKACNHQIRFGTTDSYCKKYLSL